MDLKKIKLLISGVSFLVLIVAVIAHDSLIAAVMAVMCAVFLLIILYANLAKLSNVSADSPKLRTLKFVTVFNVCFIIMIIALAIGAKRLGEVGKLTDLTETQLKLIMVLILAVPMLVFGNIAPKIPFNRYTGLRLPWTIRDEATWILAHRVLGYTSIPLVLLLMVQVPTKMDFESYVKYWWLGVVLLWIAVPGILSGIFYLKKYRRER